MLQCRDVTELTTDYMEGALSPGGTWGVRYHLMICRSCRRHVRQLRSLRRLLASLPPAAEPGVAEAEAALASPRSDLDRPPDSGSRTT